MTTANQFDQMINSIQQQTEYIQSNRNQRNQKYQECMGSFKYFLTKQTEQLQISQKANSQNKDLISKALQNTFQRILHSSDVTVRKIKQTYNQKKQFWDNVVKMNADLADLELKKQFYLQKRNAEDSYYQAIDHQKDKHKPYNALIDKKNKTQHLRDYQISNKVFQQKVVKGTNTFQQWQNITNNLNSNGHVYQYSPQTTVINQFVYKPHNPNAELMKQTNNRLEGQNSGIFLNNFQRKR